METACEHGQATNYRVWAFGPISFLMHIQSVRDHHDSDQKIICVQGILIPTRVMVINTEINVPEEHIRQKLQTDQRITGNRIQILPPRTYGKKSTRPLGTRSPQYSKPLWQAQLNIIDVRRLPHTNCWHTGGPRAGKYIYIYQVS